MFDFIKNIFKKEPQEEQIVEVDVKPKRKYKPRTPKTEVNVVEATQPAVIAQALAEPIRPRIVTKQLVGSATPAPVAEEAVEPVVEVTKKAPVKKKPVAKKPSETVVEVKTEPVLEKVAPKKPENKPKVAQNKPPRGKNKKR